MAFMAEHILYDGISSERFGLQLINDNGGLETTSGSSFSILRTPLQGGMEYVYLGKENKDPIPIELQLVSREPIDAAMQGAIYKWLVGKNGFRELRIIQNDMRSLHIGCIFNEIQFLQNGNETVGVVVTGEGDSCYFRGNDSTTNIISLTSGKFTIMNLSDTDDYIYPQIEIKMPAGGGDFSLCNTTDNFRTFSITDLSGNEVITVDNLRKIITSSTTIKRLGNFNKKWIRLLPGENIFRYMFSDGDGSFTIKTPVYKMVGQ